MLQLLLFTCLTRVTAFPFHLSHLLHKLLSATIDFPFSRVTFFHLPRLPMLSSSPEFLPIFVSIFVFHARRCPVFPARRRLRLPPSSCPTIASTFHARPRVYNLRPSQRYIYLFLFIFIISDIFNFLFMIGKFVRTLRLFQRKWFVVLFWYWDYVQIVIIH